MKLGIVTGSVTSTVKHSVYEGRRLLLVRPMDPDGKAIGSAFAAIDSVQAGPGDPVLYVDEGNSARLVLGDKNAPARAVIVAIVDRVNREWPR